MVIIFLIWIISWEVIFFFFYQSMRAYLTKLEFSSRHSVSSVWGWLEIQGSIRRWWAEDSWHRLRNTAVSLVLISRQQSPPDDYRSARDEISPVCCKEIVEQLRQLLLRKWKFENIYSVEVISWWDVIMCGYWKKKILFIYLQDIKS